ncbi:MAG: hypothetical protein NTX03_09735, partial [Bacteroidetes bacterium]|nr:hypothetical protein [Bacteroidota bacterium]
MNFKKLFLLITIIAFSAIANAQGRLAPLPKDNSVETGMMVMMVVVLLLAIILFIQILNLRLSLRSAMKSFDKKEAVEAAQPIEKRSTWWNLVYHTEAGTNQAMEGHTYDGI